jgi:hypothetical protein
MAAAAARAPPRHRRAAQLRRRGAARRLVPDDRHGTRPTVAPRRGRRTRQRLAPLRDAALAARRSRGARTVDVHGPRRRARTRPRRRAGRAARHAAAGVERSGGACGAAAGARRRSAAQEPRTRASWPRARTRAGCPRAGPALRGPAGRVGRRSREAPPAGHVLRRRAGLALPVLEALAHGAPLACSDIPPFREIAGDDAEYFDPADENSIAAALLRLGEPARWLALARRGPARAAAFSPARVAASWRTLHEQLHRGGARA